MQTERLDVLMVERGMAHSRTLAQRLVMAGQVRVNGQVHIKPSSKVSLDAVIELEMGPKYVSRGGEKLEAALIAFDRVALSGWVCADVGASTGGFTDCLLQSGATRVYAIDVGHGILDWRLRQDKRVVVMEKTNARHVEMLPELVDLVTIDASFISLKVLLPVVTRWLNLSGEIIALIKPQFEAGRQEVARGSGVVRAPEVHRKVLIDILTSCQNQGWSIGGLIKSPLTGPKGNIEFLVWLRQDDSGLDMPELVEGVMSAASGAS